MTAIPPELGKKYIAAWKEAARVLSEMRAKEIVNTDTLKGLQSLLPAFEACVRERGLSNSSGLIEQQKIFSRARKA